MLLYYLSWMFNGLQYAFLYYFWDKPTNQRPSANCCFFAYFSVSQKRNIKRNETFGRVIFGTNVIHRTWSGRQATNKEATRQEGEPTPPRRALHLCGPLVAQPTYFFLLYISIYPENIQEHHETLFPPPQPSVPKRSHLGAFFGAPLEGESITEGF